MLGFFVLDGASTLLYYTALSGEPGFGGRYGDVED
jgi:hypothetical protein